MQRKFIIGVVGGASAVLGVAGVGVYVLSGTESTTALDTSTTVQVDGQKALSSNIVAGRVQSKYHPVPLIGVKVHDVRCPTGLKAVAGATVTCSGKKSDGSSVEIPVSVVKATGDSVTWKFER
ncbi:DUF4333 domain-containing protein [Streptomyces sp. NBC_00457]|uniref:DUF4333 domain-containing protein n=1 Tax=Streptomyces sp. NBC_00457 TaxID=2975748 RepID=UPI002E1C5D90